MEFVYIHVFISVPATLLNNTFYFVSAVSGLNLASLWFTTDGVLFQHLCLLYMEHGCNFKVHV